jgi:hypothetical protein
MVTVGGAGISKASFPGVGTAKPAKNHNSVGQGFSESSQQ